MSHTSEYEVENMFIDRLESIGYKFIKLDDYDDALANLRTQLAFRKSALTEMIDKYMVIKTTEPILMVMRPYQIYAVKAAKKRVLEANQDGYVFACTGSGKTLTSFKLAQLFPSW